MLGSAQLKVGHVERLNCFERHPGYGKDRVLYGALRDRNTIRDFFDCNVGSLLGHAFVNAARDVRRVLNEISHRHRLSVGYEANYPEEAANRDMLCLIRLILGRFQPNVRHGVVRVVDLLNRSAKNREKQLELRDFIGLMYERVIIKE